MDSTTTVTAFDLPDNVAAKADPALIGRDAAHFTAIAESLQASITDLSTRLAAEKKAEGGSGQAALDRDLEVHRLTSRLRTLRRYGLDLCLGHMIDIDGERTYIGRLGLTAPDGTRLLVDWRSPAAEPFFGATHANPMGLASRRRYRWTRGRITDYWDEVFTDDLEGHAALDDQSAFIASLSTKRSDRMRDVLGTIQSDQDAIIRAGSRGALVVDGGPGTGKTVVALHRSAFLLYSDPRLQEQRRGGVLFVGPSVPYLTYVSDVLPSLGEEGVRICTLRDMVREGAAAVVESDTAVAELKAASQWPAAVDAAVKIYEEPPTQALVVDTNWDDVVVTAADWVELFEAPDPGTPHNDAREVIWDELVALIVERSLERDEDIPEDQLRRSLRQNRDLVTAFNRAWPLLEPTDIVGDLWAVPAYLRKCAPWLAPEEIKALQRAEGSAWTVADLALLDAAHRRLGDPQASRKKQHREAVLAVERQGREEVLDRMLENAEGDMESEAWMFFGADNQDMRNALMDEAGTTVATVDPLAGPFAHIVVDEAQELTDAEWQMLLQRCPSRSFTIVGDRAQARHGFTESWEERLKRIGLDQISLMSLSVNYRTPEEVMAVAEPVIRAALPDANVPTSIRSSGFPVGHGPVTDLDELLAGWLARNDEGVACVIGDGGYEGSERVRSLTPVTAKGLEFDLVVLIDPDDFGDGIEGAVDRYVAMTRATRELVILTTGS